MLNLFFDFFKIALSAFGGGSVIIALIQKEFVDTGTVASDIFLNGIAMSQATPGPIAGSIATYIGYYLNGIIGIIIANAAIALPSFLIVILFSNILERNKDSNTIKNIFKFLRPITVALVVSVLLYFINVSVFSNQGDNTITSIMYSFNARSFTVLLILLIVTSKFKLSAAKVIVISSLLGLLIL